jgi:N-acetyl-anhydromuramyl-L-alanine amidase AmpD
MKNKLNIMKKLDITSIVQTRLDETQYYAEKWEKKQIVIHHTVSGPKAENVMRDWNHTQERVGTAFIIDGQGVIHQCFSSAHWAHHLGTHFPNNTALNRHSIAIEICNWGALKEKGNKYYSSFKKEVPLKEVMDYGIAFRGFRYYQRYQKTQLESLELLLNYLCDRYQIPKTYNSDMWDISPRAIQGDPGIFTHVSYRKDKLDCHPQLELINLLKNL